MKRCFFLIFVFCLLTANPIAWSARKTKTKIIPTETKQTVIYSPNLMIEEVVRTTKELARLKGIDLQEYYINRITFNRSKDLWYVSFQGKLLKKENHFSITFGDSDKELKILGSK